MNPAPIARPILSQSSKDRIANFAPRCSGATIPILPYIVSASCPRSKVTVTSTKTIGGQTASVFLESNPSGSGIPLENYYFKNAGGVAFLGTNDVTDKITAGIAPYIVALFPVTPGVVAHFDKNGLDFGSDLDGDGINETMNLTLTSTIIDFEPLTIGIGSFTRTVKNSEAVTGSVVLSQLKTSIPFSSTSTSWSAPGIGVLKTSQSATVQSTTTGEMMEARGYTSSGVTHGFGLPFTVASNLPLNLLPVGDAPALTTAGLLGCYSTHRVCQSVALILQPEAVQFFQSQPSTAITTGCSIHPTRAERLAVSILVLPLSLIHISEPTRLGMISYAV